jgi:hypothetical protein
LGASTVEVSQEASTAAEVSMAGAEAGDKSYEVIKP